MLVYLQLQRNEIQAFRYELMLWRTIQDENSQTPPKNHWQEMSIQNTVGHLRNSIEVTGSQSRRKRNILYRRNPIVSELDRCTTRSWWKTSKRKTSKRKTSKERQRKLPYIDIFFVFLSTFSFSMFSFSTFSCKTHYSLLCYSCVTFLTCSRLLSESQSSTIMTHPALVIIHLICQ